MTAAPALLADPGDAGRHRRLPPDPRSTPSTAGRRARTMCDILQLQRLELSRVAK